MFCRLIVATVGFFLAGNVLASQDAGETETSNSTWGYQETIKRFVRDVHGVFRLYYASPGSEKSCPVVMEYLNLALYYGTDGVRSSRQVSRQAGDTHMFLFPHSGMKHISESGVKNCAAGGAAFLFELESALTFRHVKDAVEKDRTNLTRDVIEDLQSKTDNVTLMFEVSGRPCGATSLQEETVLLFVQNNVRNVTIKTKAADIFYPAGTQMVSLFSSSGDDVSMCLYQNIEDPVVESSMAMVNYTYQKPSPLPGVTAPPETTTTTTTTEYPLTLMVNGKTIVTNEDRNEVQVPQSNVTSAEEPSCFAGDATVELLDGSLVSMDTLKIGSEVKVGVNKYSPVILFTHQLRNVKSSFFEISTSSGDSVVLTAGHYIHTFESLVAASSVKVGDFLVLGDGRVTRVETVERVSKAGLYNPQTANGNIVVNQILCSCYTTAVEATIAHAALAPLRLNSRMRWLFEMAVSGFEIGTGLAWSEYRSSKISVVA